MAQFTQQLITTAALANKQNEKNDFNMAIAEKSKDYDKKNGTKEEIGAFLGDSSTSRSTVVEPPNTECNKSGCNVMGGKHSLRGKHSLKRNHRLRRRHTNKYK